MEHPEQDILNPKLNFLRVPLGHHGPCTARSQAHLDLVHFPGLLHLERALHHFQGLQRILFLWCVESIGHAVHHSPGIIHRNSPFWGGEIDTLYLLGSTQPGLLDERAVVPEMLLTDKDLHLLTRESYVKLGSLFGDYNLRSAYSLEHILNQ